MDDSTKTIVRIIRKYLADLEHIGGMCCWNTPRFEDITYETIAANTILDIIENNKSLEPKAIIEDFRAKMNKYVYMNTLFSRHYSIQADAATYILDEIEYEERRLNQNGQIKIRKTNR